MLGVSAGVRQQLSEHLYAGLNFGYDNTDYVLLGAGTSNNRSDGYFSARVGLDYEFNRHLTGGLFYVRQQDDSNIQSYSYEDNLIGVQLSWSL